MLPPYKGGLGEGLEGLVGLEGLFYSSNTSFPSLSLP